jgi:hypothetical protein
MHYSAINCLKAAREIGGFPDGEDRGGRAKRHGCVLRRGRSPLLEQTEDNDQKDRLHDGRRPPAGAEGWAGARPAAKKR